MITKKIPLWLSVKVCTPFFRFIERNGDDYTLTYRGETEFELVGQATEREIGRWEAFISAIPPAWLLFPYLMSVVMMDVSALSLVVWTALGVPPLIAGRMLGEVRIEHIGGEA